MIPRNAPEKMSLLSVRRRVLILCYNAPMTKTKIEALLREQFQPTHVFVIDDSHTHAGHAGASQGGHFTVEIAADVFKGKKLLESHRMIYAALAPIKAEIHALAIKVR